MSSLERPHPVIGEILTTLRHRLERTQEELSEATGIHVTEISRLENGWRNPPWETMKTLARGLEVPCWHMVALAETLDMERGAQPGESG
jgi:transcriptional regulator with XRE-family HTH domain